MVQKKQKKRSARKIAARAKRRVNSHGSPEAFWEAIGQGFIPEAFWEALRQRLIQREKEGPLTSEQKALLEFLNLRKRRRQADLRKHNKLFAVIQGGKKT